MTPEEADKAYDESPSIPISDDEIERLVKAATAPRTVPFERGRTIILTHYEFADHEEVTAQWQEKTGEDGGELWQGRAATLHGACRNAIDAMFDRF
jgi:hypothetical protein